MIGLHSCFPCSLSSSPSLFSDTEKRELKRHRLDSERMLFIVFDPIQGMIGILQSQNKEIILPFLSFVGVPKELQFSFHQLVPFLEQSCVKTKLDSEGKGTIFVQQRIMGGGSNVTKHEQSEPRKIAEKPAPIFIDFPYAFTIRRIRKKGEGTFTKERGGLENTYYTATYECAAEIEDTPTVYIHCWKRDVYARQIQVKRQEEEELLEARSLKWKEIASIQIALEEIGRLEEIKKDWEACRFVTTQLEISLSTISEKIQNLKNRLDKFKTEIHKNSKDIRTLIQSILVIRKLGLESLQSNHPSIETFKKKYRSFEKLIGTTANHQGLLGSTLLQLEKIVVQSELAKDNLVLALVGNTGAGKSTLVNWLLGLKMASQLIERKRRIVVANGIQEAAKIGHQLATSETTYTEIFPFNPMTVEGKKNLGCIADCGGFSDTRGIANELLAATSLQLTLSVAQGVRLLLVIDAASLLERGNIFFNIVHLSLRQLLNNFDINQHSFAILFTKPNNQISDSEDARDYIKRMKRELEEMAIESSCPLIQGKLQLCQSMLRDNGKCILVCDPLSENSRQEVLDLIESLQPIYNTSQAFRILCSPNSSRAIFEEMLTIAALANGLFTQFNQCQRELAEEKKKEKETKEELRLNRKKEESFFTDISSENVSKIIKSALSPVDLTNKLRITEYEVIRLNEQLKKVKGQIEKMNKETDIIYKFQNNSWKLGV